MPAAWQAERTQSKNGVSVTQIFDRSVSYSIFKFFVQVFLHVGKSIGNAGLRERFLRGRQLRMLCALIAAVRAGKKLFGDL